MPTISVVVLTYNNQKYIERCVNSILKGTFKDLEVVVVNNGSTDNTEALIQEMITQDPRIVYVPLEKNIGIFSGRIEGMKIAKGQYIGFSDSDDFYEPNAFEVLYNTSQEYHADIVTAHLVRNENNHKGINNNFSFGIYKNTEVLRSYLNNEPYSNLWCALFHHKLVDQALHCYPKGLHILGGEDYIHNIYLHFFAKKKVQITVPIYHWCINTQSVSMKISTKKSETKVLEDYQSVYLVIENFLHEQNCYETFSSAWLTFIKKQFMPLFTANISFGHKIAMEWSEKANPKFLIQLILLLNKREAHLINKLGILPLHKQIIVCSKHIVKQILKVFSSYFRK